MIKIVKKRPRVTFERASKLIRETYKEQHLHLNSFGSNDDVLLVEDVSLYVEPWLHPLVFEQTYEESPAEYSPLQSAIVDKLVTVGTSGSGGSSSSTAEAKGSSSPGGNEKTAEHTAVDISLAADSKRTEGVVSTEAE